MLRLKIKASPPKISGVRLTLIWFPLAIDRVHRLGQEKTVYVKHFIVCRPSFRYLITLLTQNQVSDTIEDRILEIQRRKTAIIKEAFRGKGGKGDPESIDNLKIMFGI